MDGSQASYSVSSAELRSFVERIEKLRAEKADVNEREKEVFAEMKGRGYMTRPVRTLIAERKRRPDDLAEENAILEMYRLAMGME